MSETCDWRTVLLPNGRLVECMDVRIAEMDPPDLLLDVTVSVDGVLQTMRVRVDPEHTAGGEQRG